MDGGGRFGLGLRLEFGLELWFGLRFGLAAETVFAEAIEFAGGAVIAAGDAALQVGDADHVLEVVEGDVLAGPLELLIRRHFRPVLVVLLFDFALVGEEAPAEEFALAEVPPFDGHHLDEIALAEGLGLEFVHELLEEPVVEFLVLAFQEDLAGVAAVLASVPG
jgi:hypothetical protein